MQADYEMALSLQKQFQHEEELNNPTRNLVYTPPKKAAVESKSLTDNSWELIDPTPNVHVLFMAFDRKYFWNKLVSVVVSWSPRMTTCAGICSYQNRAGFCHITLSEPLLKLRPRKDLIQTLLHEMIHAYLFITKNNRDRDGHGPEFHSHMHRINAEAGTNISVYHDFHDEVRLYQQHWWRCDGPCQKQKPYFGMVRRAMNRAPGPNDRWWTAHQQTCGGTFIKVKEPEKTTVKKPRKEVKKNVTNDIRSFYPPPLKQNDVHGLKDVKPRIKTAIKNSSSTVVITKKSNVDVEETPSSLVKQPSPVIAFVGTGQVLDAASSSDAADYSAVRDSWLKKFVSSDSATKRSAGDSLTVIDTQKRAKHDDDDDDAKVNCPVCEMELPPGEINAHLDLCLAEKNRNEERDVEKMKCLVCNKLIDQGTLFVHLDECVADSVFTNANEANESNDCLVDDNSVEMTYNCPVCSEVFPLGQMSAHLDKCLIEEESDGNCVARAFFDEDF